MLAPRCQVSRFIASVAFVVLMVSWGCTDVGLCEWPCKDLDAWQPDNVVELTGTVCTVDPAAVVFPYKILFIIDLSTSNYDSDPNDNRAKAVQNVIEDYADNPALSFAAIGFSTYAEAETPAFTRDRDLLIPDVINKLSEEIEDTNYLDTLDLAYRFIESDILKTPEATRARTRYDIQWLSDGIPDPCQRPPSVEIATEELMKLKELYGLFDLRLSTTRLYHPGYTVAGCEDVGPDDYLAPMAELGHGTYQTLTDDELEFKISFSEIARRFEQREFFVVNENRVVWGNQLWPDSDGDGLRDLDDEYEPDPLLADWNNDGCSDRVDQELLPNIDLCSEHCSVESSGQDPSQLDDTDMDEIPDCAEQTLGYRSLSADSDRDGFGDLVELRFGTNPVDQKTLSRDGDGDGMTDADEIRMGTNPRVPEEDDSLAYQYGPLTYAPSVVDGTSCFGFQVQNVQLAQTLQTETAEEGDNRLCVYLVQTPVDGPKEEPTVTRACKTARYRLLENGELKEPPDGRVEFVPEDFECLSTACQIPKN